MKMREPSALAAGNEGVFVHHRWLMVPLVLIFLDRLALEGAPQVQVECSLWPSKFSSGMKPEQVG